MSNKEQLQENNTKYAALIELLRGKAAGGGGGITVSLPTYRVTIWDNDGADVTVTVMVNEGGMLKPQSTTIPNGGSINVMATWNTPIFITSKYVSTIQVYNFDDDMVNCPVYYDSNNNTHAVSIPYDNGNQYTIYAFM